MDSNFMYVLRTVQEIVNKQYEGQVIKYEQEHYYQIFKMIKQDKKELI